MTIDGADPWSDVNDLSVSLLGSDIFCQFRFCLKIFEIKLNISK